MPLKVYFVAAGGVEAIAVSDGRDATVNENKERIAVNLVHQSLTWCTSLGRGLKEEPSFDLPIALSI
jgi:hypothetical protein